VNLYLFLLTLMTLPHSPDAHWPAWRGPDTSGAAAGAPPITWSESEHIRWKVAVPGFGLASPVIWGDQLFLLTAVKTERAAEGPATSSGPGKLIPDRYHQFVIMSLDRGDGSTRWQQVAVEQVPHETVHGDASWASISPVTDGTCLIASFGSAGIFCYDLSGTPQWQVDLGDMRTRNGFGEGSSPVLHGDLVVVNWDHEEQSFIVALDKKTGAEIWRRERDEPTSWSTPAIVEVEGKPQVVVSATKRVRGYDLATGSSIWEVGGMTTNTIPSPIVDGTKVYVTSGFRGNALLALELKGATGDLTGSGHVLWQFDRDTPYVPSMLLYDGALYFIKHNKGILTCLDAVGGQVHYGPERLEDIDGVYASPVAAGGHVYIIGRNGHAAVVKKGAAFEVVAHNRLDDHFDASAAIAGDTLYLRGHKYLYAIGATAN